MNIAKFLRTAFFIEQPPVAVSGHLYHFLIFFCMFTNSYRMTYIFSSVLIFLDSEYSKEKIQHQSKEYVLSAKLKEECQDNFNGELETK